MASEITLVWLEIMDLWYWHLGSSCYHDGDDDGGDDVVGGRICFEESDLAKVVTRLAPRGVGELQIQRIHNDDYKSTIVIITKTRCKHKRRKTKQHICKELQFFGLPIGWLVLF